MYFHVIGIKEKEKNKKYNIDIVLESDSESFLKDFLYTNNIIILNYSEYKRDIKSFWNLEILINYKQKIIKAVSYSDDIVSLVKYFMMIWFDVKYANFISSNRLSDLEVSNIIKESFLDVQNFQNQIKENSKEKENQNKKIYQDEKLQKTIKILLSALKEVDILLSNTHEFVSQDKIRDIKVLYQELIKLKMWRNADKMLEVLEDIYHKMYEIQQEYLLSRNVGLPISWSKVTNIDIMSEINKYKKAKNIKNILAKRDIEDNYYLSFEQLGIHIKFLIKDLKYSLKNISNLFFNSFDYLEILFVFVILMLTIILWFNKVSYSLLEEHYLYFSLIKTWTFGLIFFVTKAFRKQYIKRNLWLFLLAMLLSYFIFRLLINNLSF